jgi:hypothetical protein
LDTDHPPALLSDEVLSFFTLPPNYDPKNLSHFYTVPNEKRINIGSAHKHVYRHQDIPSQRILYKQPTSPDIPFDFTAKLEASASLLKRKLSLYVPIPFVPVMLAKDDDDPSGLAGSIQPLVSDVITFRIRKSGGKIKETPISKFMDRICADPSTINPFKVIKKLMKKKTGFEPEDILTYLLRQYWIDIYMNDIDGNEFNWLYHQPTGMPVRIDHGLAFVNDLVPIEKQVKLEHLNLKPLMPKVLRCHSTNPHIVRVAHQTLQQVHRALEQTITEDFLKVLFEPIFVDIKPALKDEEKENIYKKFIERKDNFPKYVKGLMTPRGSRRTKSVAPSFPWDFKSYGM